MTVYFQLNANTLWEHKTHQMIQEQSYSIQHEQQRMKLPGAQSLTELRVICAYRRSVISRSPSMWSLADSSETITKRRNNDNNIGNHEKSNFRTWRLYCTLLNNGSNATELLLGETPLLRLEQHAHTQ